MTKITETKVLTFRTHPAMFVPGEPGGSVALNINIHAPETVSQIGEGWEPISHQVMPFNDEILLSILVQRVTDTDAIPDAI